MQWLLYSFLLSGALCAAILRTKSLHKRFSGDNQLDLPQKIHKSIVPRVGGLAIFLAVLGVLIWVFARKSAQFNPAGDAGDLALLSLLQLLACALPVFLLGLSEDLLKHISPFWRLMGAVASASLAAFWLNAQIAHGDLPMLGRFVLPALLALSLTAFAVTGLVHSINIIDGMNGLASMTAIMMFASMAMVAHQVGDTMLLQLSLLMIGAILGFFIWNYPAGWLFLGDGGAYFIGFMLAENAILLVQRNPSVSSWYPFLLFIYPAFETAFTIYRRRFLRGRAVDVPDALHLHSLLFRRVMRKLMPVQMNQAHAVTKRNALTSPLLWLLCLLAVFPATLWWQSTLILSGLSLFFCVSYVFLYQRIIRFNFNSPRPLARK